MSSSVIICPSLILRTTGFGTGFASAAFCGALLGFAVLFATAALAAGFVALVANLVVTFVAAFLVATLVTTLFVTVFATRFSVGSRFGSQVTRFIHEASPESEIASPESEIIGKRRNRRSVNQAAHQTRHYIPNSMSQASLRANPAQVGRQRQHGLVQYDAGPVGAGDAPV